MSQDRRRREPYAPSRQPLANDKIRLEIVTPENGPSRDPELQWTEGPQDETADPRGGRYGAQSGPPQEGARGLRGGDGVRRPIGARAVPRRDVPPGDHRPADARHERLRAALELAR